MPPISSSTDFVLIFKKRRICVFFFILLPFPHIKSDKNFLLKRTQRKEVKKMKKTKKLAAIAVTVSMAICGGAMSVSATPESSPYCGEWRVAEVLSGLEKVSVEDIDFTRDAYLAIDEDGTSTLDIERYDGSSVAYLFPSVAANGSYTADLNDLGLSLEANDFSYAEGCSFVLTVVDNNSEREVELLMEGSSFPTL